MALAAVGDSEAPEIVRRSAVKINEDWEQAPNYGFVERDVLSKRDAEQNAKTYQVTMIDGSPYRRLIAVNDSPVSEAVAAEESRKLALETARREHETLQDRSRRIEKYRKERTQDRVMMQEMTNAFTFQAAGEETVDGHRCRVFDAEPKDGYQPPNRESKVLTGMRGRLWIDERQNQWVKVEAQVFKPVSFFGFLAKVEAGTKFELEQEPVAAGIWLPKHFSMQVKASALGFINQDSSEDDTYRDYRSSGKTSAELDHER